MRSKCLLSFILALALTPLNGFAQGRSTTQQSALNTRDKTDEFGVGLQVGSLSGVNFEYWLAQQRTLNAAFTAERGNIAINAAHTWLFHDSFSGQFNNFVPFVGAGLIGAWGDRSDYFRRSHDENFAMALHAPVGIEYLPRLQRFSVFLEVAPSLQFVPESFAFLTGDLGARFYF